MNKAFPVSRAPRRQHPWRRLAASAPRSQPRRESRAPGGKPCHRCSQPNCPSRARSATIAESISDDRDSRLLRALLIILLVMLILLQVKLWREYAEVRDLRGLVEQQVEANEALRARNEALAAEVEDLREGLDAIEERARAELGLIREGEEFYQVIEPEDLPDE